MSDPAPEPPIEDVLSSIRRLVSTEVDRQVTTAGRPGRDGDGPDARLVLTADLRVPRDDDPAVDDPGPAADGGGDLTLEQRIAGLEAAIAAAPSEFEPDGSEDVTQHRPTAVPRRPPRTGAGVDDMGFLRDTAALRDDPVPATTQADASMANDTGDGESDEERLARYMHLLAEDVEIDMGDEDAPDDDPDGADDAAPDAVPDASVVDLPPLRLDARDAVAGASDGPAAEGADLPMPSAFVSGPDTAQGLAAASSAEDAALRAMVAEIVREELKGPLGERITRNVRKMVRREIMRILASRDFD